MTLKRYALFHGDEYYPCGGWDDFKGSFDTVKEAKENMKAQGWPTDWHHIVDLQTGTVIEDSP